MHLAFILWIWRRQNNHSDSCLSLRVYILAYEIWGNFIENRCTLPSFKLKISVCFITSSYVIFSLSVVQAIDIFMITLQDVTKPRENCNLKLPIVFSSVWEHLICTIMVVKYRLSQKSAIVTRSQLCKILNSFWKLTSCGEYYVNKLHV